MNLLAKRENELPVELEHSFPGVEEFFRTIFSTGGGICCTMPPIPGDPSTISRWRKRR